MGEALRGGEPLRTDGGSRLYTEEDISRLALIKHLTDSGDAIGTVASLSLTELEKRVDMMGRGVRLEPAQPETTRIAVVGHALTARVARYKGELGELKLVGIFRDTDHLRDQLETHDTDIVVVEIPYIKSNTSTEIEQLINDTGATGAVIVYGFGSRRHIRRLRMLPVVTLRAPADIADLKRACMVASASGSFFKSEHQPRGGTMPSNIPPRRYSDDKLARIATLSTTVECECPHHLADLVLSLVSFEHYSADCVNENESDAALHRYLHATTAQARSQLETALARLVEVEGLEV